MREYVLGSALVLTLSACAGPFLAVGAGTATSGQVVATFCGSSSARTASVIAALDGPPLASPTPTMEPPREVTICVQLDNRGSRPVQIDRSRFHLKCPREQQPWIPDQDDTRFVVPPQSTRKLKVTFSYSPLLSGEDVRLLFDEVAVIGERAISVPPLSLRKR